MPIQIHTNTGRETEVLEILNAWKTVYPERFRFFKHALENLRQVQKNADGSFVDQQGRVARISYRMPTELWLFMKRRIPDWGNDHKDIALLLRVAGDFAKTTIGNPRRVFSTTDWKRKKERREKKHEDLKRSNSKKRHKDDQGNPGELEEARNVG